MDFFNEYYDVIFNGYYDFIIGSVVAFFIGKFFDVILCFFKKICYGIIGKKETDPSPTPIESIEVNNTNIDIDESVEIDYKDINSFFGNSNITNYGNITINMPPTTKETNKPDKQEDKK